jgi:hypothetical protein
VPDRVMVGSTHFFVASGPQRMVVATSSMYLWRMQSNEIRWQKKYWLRQ